MVIEKASENTFNVFNSINQFNSFNAGIDVVYSSASDRGELLEDGTYIFSELKVSANIDSNLLEKINSADSFTLLDMILEDPGILEDRLVLSELRRAEDIMAGRVFF